MTTKKFDSRCKAKTKSGKACRAAATSGGLCFFHANPDKAAELGRIGGRKNAHTRVEPAGTLPSLDTAIAVRNTVARLIDDLYSRKLHPKVASGLSSLLSLQLRALETSDLERRLAKVEKLIARRQTSAANKSGNGENHSWPPEDQRWKPPDTESEEDSKSDSQGV